MVYGPKCLLVTVLSLAACSSRSASQVDWKNYAPDVRVRIDAIAEAENTDCNLLEAEFEAAKANDTAQETRTGDGNEDLMAYINLRADEAGCFPEGSPQFS